MASAVIPKGCIAVIGDMVASRELTPARRRETQKRFTKFISALNEQFAPALLAKFVITVGDEFQGLITDGSILPDVIWKVARGFSDRALRLGFGYGRLDTPVGRYAINVDGPALHCARDAINHAKKRNELGGVFRGFGDNFDLALNGVARLLEFHREQRTEQQMRVIGMLRQGLAQVRIAEKLKLSTQAISDHVRAAGWDSYRQGEMALSAAMSLFASQTPRGKLR